MTRGWEGVAIVVGESLSHVVKRWYLGFELERSATARDFAKVSQTHLGHGDLCERKCDTKEYRVVTVG